MAGSVGSETSTPDPGPAPRGGRVGQWWSRLRSRIGGGKPRAERRRWPRESFPVDLFRGPRAVEATRARWRRVLRRQTVVIVVVLVAAAVAVEIATSRRQALYFTSVARGLAYHMSPGRATASTSQERPLRPAARLCPAPRVHRDARARRLPRPWSRHAGRRSSSLGGSRARFSRSIRKDAGGAHILDRRGRASMPRCYPPSAYKSFDRDPARGGRLAALHREPRAPRPDATHLNPAVEWDRFAAGGAQRSAGSRSAGTPTRPGGSTLATQLEKLRHSPEGRTVGAAREAEADVHGGGARVPRRPREPALAPRGGGRLHQLRCRSRRCRGAARSRACGDGLEAWFGPDFDAVNRLLLDARTPSPPRRGLAYRACSPAARAAPSDPRPRRRPRRARGRIEQLPAAPPRRGVIPGAGGGGDGAAARRSATASPSRRAAGGEARPRS